MAKSAEKKDDTSGTRGKRGHGEGHTMMIIFRSRTDREYMAMHVSQHLAELGLRSHYMISVMAAIYQVWSLTGKFPDVEDIVSRIQKSDDHQIKE